MDQAIKKYFDISNVLNDDFFKLNEENSESDHWRRNHIRVLAVLIEGYSHCFREIAKVGMETGTVKYSAKERKLLEEEHKCSVTERIKGTLKIIYSLFGLAGPDFGSTDWQKAKKALEKRGALMHPKSVADLEVSDQVFLECDQGFGWLVAQHTTVISHFYKIARK